MPFIEEIQMSLQTIPSLGTPGLNGTVSGNGVCKIESFLDETLPDPLVIVGAISWVSDGSYPLPANAVGNIAYAIDPSGAMEVPGGWPFAQRFEPIKENTLLIHEVFAGGSRQCWRDFNYPMAYRSGDIIQIEPEIQGGGAIIRPFLCLRVLSDTPIYQWPKASYLFNVPQDTSDAGGGPGYSLRNFVPGPPVAATQVRFRFNHVAAATQDCTVDHASVGIQNGTTSSTVGVPTPLSFAGLSAFNIYPDTSLWSDWVNLPVSPGQNLLVTGSLFNAGGNDFWSTTISGGLGSWLATSDSWNTADLQGTVTAQPTRTHLIDKAQYR